MSAGAPGSDAPAGAVTAIRPTDEEPLETLWSVMADGLTVQRFGLHVEQWASLHRADARAVGVVDHPPVRTLCPRWQATHEAVVALEGGRLGWVASLPASAPADLAVGTPLVPAPSTSSIVDDVADPDLRAAVAACGEAAAWWVAFFASIRDDGFQHESLADVDDEVDLDTLAVAAELLALGWTTRVLTTELVSVSREQATAASRRTGELRWLLCQSVARSVQVERELAGLLTGLGELRLVELVTTAFPSRRQYTAYRSGTGPAQVEA